MATRAKELSDLGNSGHLNVHDDGTVTLEGGNVGIGVTDPDSALEVQSASSGNNSLHIANTSSTGYGAKFLGGGNTATRYIADFRNYSGVSKVKIDGDGNVGIGTTTITTSTLGTNNRFLEVSAGTNNGSGTLVLSRNTSADNTEIGGIRFVNQNNADDTNLDADGKFVAAISVRSKTSDSNASDDSGADMIFYTKPEAGNYTERLRINSSGNIGIGNSSPENALHIASSDDAQMLVQNTSTGDASIKFNRSGQTFFIGIESSDNSFRISDTGTGVGDGDRVVIKSNGLVGLNNNNPLSSLAVYHSAASAYSSTADSTSNMSGIRVTASPNQSVMTGIWFGTGGDQTGSHWTGIAGSRTNHASDWGTRLSFYTHPTATTSASETYERMTIDPAGNVGIGTTSPSSKLHVEDGDLILGNWSTYPGDGGSSDHTGGATGKLKFALAYNSSSYDPTIELFRRNDWSASIGIMPNQFTLASGNSFDFRTLATDSNPHGGRVLNITELGRLAVTSTDSIPLNITVNGQTDSRVKVYNSNASGTFNYFELQTNGRGNGYLIKNIANNGNGLSNGSLYLWNGGGPAGEDIIEFVPNGDITKRVTIEENGNLIARGNVGIGTASPDARLDLGTLNSSTAGSNQMFQLGAFGFRHEDTGGFNHLYLERNYGGWQTTPQMTFKANGHIGINTGDPDDILTINQGGASKYIRMEGPSSGDVAGGLQLFRGSTLRASFYANPTHNLTILSETGINFRADGAQRMKIDSSAAMVAINGDTADHTGTSGGSRGLSLATAGGTSVPLYFGSETNSAQKSMYLNSYWIYLRGHQNEGMRFVFSQGAGTAIRSDQYQFKYNSATRPTGNTTWDGFSDARAKENVQPLTNALDTISQLNPVTFDWTNDYADSMNMFEMDKTDPKSYNWTSVKENGYDLDRKTAQVGFIAQEFETVFPKSITEQELELGDTTIEDFKTVNYDHLIPTLTKAIQELKAENDTLRARLDAAGIE